MTPPPPDKKTVQQVEVLISTILRTGVTLSFVLVVVGTVISFAHHPAYLDSPGTLGALTAPAATRPHTLRGVLEGIGQSQGRSIIMVSLLLLIATPIVRVAVSILAFVYEKDWIFVGITAVVLLLLLLSFFLGKAG